MSDTLESLKRTIDRATELGAVVRSMKALSASSIHLYEQAVRSLEDYNRTVQMGLYICRAELSAWIGEDRVKPGHTGAVIFGAGQGLVGQFNEVICRFAKGRLDLLPGKKTVWAVGETIGARLEEAGLSPAAQFPAPHSIHTVTQLIAQVLIAVEKGLESGEISSVYLFYNRPQKGALYAPSSQRFFPLDGEWLKELSHLPWQTGKIPEIVLGSDQTVKGLIQEFFFTTLYRACAESLASENASRLAAMQRAEKNIRELLGNLNLAYHQLRQSTIDEELFDVVAGAEALTG